MGEDLARALAELDPAAGPEALAASRSPLLIGVRHHSPALAAAMPKILDAFAPTAVLIELPSDLGSWLPWLGSPGLVAPVALSATSPDGSLSFYPFADFSPELAAMRWAQTAGVAVTAIDRPVSAKTVRGAEDSPHAGRLLAHLPGGDDTGELWDTLVEARAPGDPEALRRAALAFGWLMRADSLHGGGISREDATREAHMRGHVQSALSRGKKPRVCAVVGAFHANALLERPLIEPAHEPIPAAEASDEAARVGALVPYDFELLDARSGYPAGIRDPMLTQRAFELFSVGLALDSIIPELLVDIARELRGRGHVASFADLREAARMSLDLAALRGLRAPGRRELLDAIESTMTQGEPLGRGRVVARALEAVLVGHRRGRLPEGAPRAGLSVSVNALLEELRLPGPEAGREAKEFTLDPERSPLDRRRAIVLAQLEVCNVPYAEKRGRGVAGSRGDIDNLTTRVALTYTPETAARLELAGLFGSTLPAAAEGSLRRSFARAVEEGAGLARVWIQHLAQAATAGLATLTHDLLDQLSDTLLPAAGLADLADALALVGRIDKGHVAGLRRTVGGDEDSDAFVRALAGEQEQILFAALRTLEGIVGSTDERDVRAFAELLALFESHDLASLRFVVATFASLGSPLMRGAGAAAAMLLGIHPPEAFFATFVSFFDTGGDDASAATRRTESLRGALLMGGAVFEGHPTFVEEILHGLDRMDDARFLVRLPSLRGGFDVLSAADRQRMLDVVGAPLNALTLHVSADELAACALADAAGLFALQGASLSVALEALPIGGPQSASEQDTDGVLAFRQDHAIPIADRLRLVLGREPSQLGHGAIRYARALDELYGQGHGEGSREGLGGGTEGSYPTAREWGDELRELFGEEVREEVLGRAAQGGHGAALALLDPDEVTPSVDLLEQILSLKGGLSARDFEHLKRLAKRVIDALVRELSTATKPALSGLATPRASRRRSGPLDLRRTIRDNLATATVEDGVYRLAPRSFTFLARAKKSLDWRIVLVVDVSGSMETSVLHSAMMAGILGSLPSVSTHFLAVNDRVADLSGHAADPLELLLSVRIGGGTLLTRGLRHARGLITVPTRTIVVLVSDFEEGGSVGELVAEVRTLKESGAHLLGLAALGEGKAPRYHRAIAERIVAAGMPVAALSPLELARWVGEKIRGVSS